MTFIEPYRVILNKVHIKKNSFKFWSIYDVIVWGKKHFKKDFFQVLV